MAARTSQDPLIGSVTNVSAPQLRSKSDAPQLSTTTEMWASIYSQSIEMVRKSI